jgi:hypothetical protein
MTDVNQLLTSLKPGAKLTDFATLVPLLQAGLDLEGDDEAASLIAKALDGPLIRMLGMQPGLALGGIPSAVSIDYNQIIGILLPFLLAFIKQQLQPKPQPTATPTPEPAAAPAPASTPTPQPAASLVKGYPMLKVGILMFSRKGKPIHKGSPEYEGIIAGEGGAQLVDDKCHLNISPFDSQGKEIMRDDPRHVDPDANGYPMIRYRWWINGVQQHDTNHDHFRLSSIFSKNDPQHVYDNGCTPTLKLTQAWGPGKGKAEFQAYIDEDYNGSWGHQESNIVSWYCD